MKSLRYNDQGSIKSWINIWDVRGNSTDAFQSRTPGLYYSPSQYGKLSINAADNTTTSTYTGAFTELRIPNILGDWVYFTQVIQKFTVKLYINGELYAEFVTKSPQVENYLGDATLYLGEATYYSTNCSYKNIDLFKRDLTPVEIKALYNQQLFLETVCDGVGTNPKPFTYLSEREKLIRILTDESGNIVKHELVKKPGYVATTDNIVKYENGQLIDRYGKNVLSNNLNKIMHFSSNTLVSVNANSVWGTFLITDIPMDTTKYDYVFRLNTTIYTYNSSALTVLMGGNFNISIGNKPIVTSAHRGQTSFGSAVIISGHETVDVVSPVIDRDFKGLFKVRCSLCRSTQDATACTVENHNNAANLLTAPFSKTTPTHLSTLTVYEINKVSTELM